MKRKKRRHAPRLPQFRPTAELEPGDPVNPYRYLQRLYVDKAIMSTRKLRPGAKLVLMLLCNEVYQSGYDKHTHENLAAKVGLGRRQFERHLYHLVKAKLVHVEREFGRQDFHWILWTPLFADCSPWTPVINDDTPTSETTEGLRRNVTTQRTSQRTYSTKSGATRLFHTISVDNVPANGRKKGETREPEREGGELPITDSLTTLQIAPAARSFFYSLTPHEKRNRYDQAGRLLDQLAVLRQYLGDPHPDIRRQTEHEIRRRVLELEEIGFILAQQETRKR